MPRDLAGPDRVQPEIQRRHLSGYRCAIGNRQVEQRPRIREADRCITGDGQRVNFGANLIVWNRLFGSASEPNAYPIRYGTPNAPKPWRQ